ncbi:hypothetical protein TKK_0010743 [Trichogramma kaykai]
MSPCEQYKYCNGKIKSCNSLNANTRVCHSSDSHSKSKYDYAETEGKILGKMKPPCRGSTYTHQFMETFGVTINTWASCLCTCESSDSKMYINLKEAVSNVNENMVITGIRFKKVRNILYLQIEQAKLLPLAGIDSKTRSWVPVDDPVLTSIRVGVDHHQLSWDHRSFELDDVEVAKNTVLTGVKFTFDQGLIRLEVRGTQFDYEDGKLITNKYSWHRHKTSKNQLKYFELEHLDIPEENSIRHPVLTDKQQYMSLTTSNMNDDLGQTILPFVDLREITSSNPDVSLSGIGLFHKSHKKNAAGFLALKILTYNFN